MKNNKEKILNLVKKLLALSKSSNEYEAAIAASRAQDLLFKYNLSLAEVKDFKDESTPFGGIAQKKISVFQFKNDGIWKKSLMASVAHYNFCDFINNGAESSFIIIGKLENLEVVAELFQWLVIQIGEAAFRACEKYCGLDRISTFRRAFYSGAVSIIHSRLEEKWEELRNQNSSSTALVVRNENFISEYENQNFPNIKTMKISTRNVSLDGLFEGRRAGEGISLEVRKKLENKIEGRIE